MSDRLAEANLTRDKALLAQAEAQLSRDAANAEYQQVTSERQSQLTARGILSKDAADESRARADATLALVKADKANEPPVNTAVPVPGGLGMVHTRTSFGTRQAGAKTA